MQARSSAAKILIADDSEVERASARGALQSLGYEVVEAVDGQHALEVYARERPDLVLLDVVMPRLTGVEACRILKAKTQSSYLPVIMLSTRNSVNARVEGLRSGADDYLGKPYEPDELRARVEALLRARRFVVEPDTVSRAAASEPLVGIQAFHAQMVHEFSRAQRYADPLACLRVEAQASATGRGLQVDEHDAIDRAVSVVILASVRRIDHVFQSGIRSYVLVLPNTHFPGALAVAERIWRDTRRTKLPSSRENALTVSVGVSFFPGKGLASMQDLLDLADAALERAREEDGKICLFQHQGYLYTPES